MRKRTAKVATEEVAKEKANVAKEKPKVAKEKATKNAETKGETSTRRKEEL